LRCGELTLLAPDVSLVGAGIDEFAGHCEYLRRNNRWDFDGFLSLVAGQGDRAGQPEARRNPPGKPRRAGGPPASPAGSMFAAELLLPALLSQGNVAELPPRGVSLWINIENEGRHGNQEIASRWRGVERASAEFGVSG
jgi:hypothetical protein